MNRAPAALLLGLLGLLGCAGDDLPSDLGDPGNPDSAAAAGAPAARPPRLRLGEARSTPALGDEERARIKRATALIRTAEGSGSGFALLRSEKTGLLVLTNAHVVPAGAEVEVIFDSGGPTEAKHAAQWLAADPRADLCVLEIEAAGDREVLQLAPADDLYETQPLMVAGFPLGNLAGLGLRSNPEPTLTTATVSSLRHNSRGALETVQLDGDLNPGNSGGPILAGDGRVAGVAVATVLTTNISFMIPASAVHRFLDGVAEVSFETEGFRERQPDDDRWVVTLLFKLGDPLRRIIRVGVDAESGAELAAESPAAGSSASGSPAAEHATVRLVLGEQPLPARLTPWYENAAGRQALEPFEISPPEPPSAPPPPRPLEVPPPPRPLEVPPAPPPAKPWPMAAAAAPPAERPLSGLHREIRPQAGAGRLARQPMKERADAVLERIEIDARKLSGAFQLSPDGRYAFVAESTGLLRRIALADLREVTRLDVEAPIAALAPSKDGLLVLLESLPELLILDWSTLRPSGAVSVPGAERLAASPRSSLAFAATGAQSRESGLMVIDVAARRLLMRFAEADFDAAFKEHIRRRDRSPSFGCQTMAMAPDGKSLLCTDVTGFGGIHRVALKRRQLIYEEASPRLNLQAGWLAISPDSRRLAVPFNHRHDDDGYPAHHRGTFLFDLDDLRIPAVTLDMRGHLVFTGDPKLPYAVAEGDLLTAFTAHGARRRSVELPGTIRGLWPLPGGRGLWLLTNRALVSVRFK